tara:strand:- start:20 stop:595 length:576 start_codon:yes stop_codon:yes gene_type:complete
MLSTAVSIAVPAKSHFTTAVALAAILVTGTGVADSRDYRSSVNKNWVIQQQVSVSNEVSSQDMVKKVLSRFGLTVKDFESILGVKRAAIYNWKKGANEPNETQFDILKRLYQVALFLDSEGVKIGRLAKTNIYQDKSMIERLSAPVIDVEGVVEHHKLLVAKVLRQREIFEQIVDDNLLTEGDSFVVVEGK